MGVGSRNPTGIYNSYHTVHRRNKTKTETIKKKTRTVHTRYYRGTIDSPCKPLRSIKASRGATVVAEQALSLRQGENGREAADATPAGESTAASGYIPRAAPAKPTDNVAGPCQERATRGQKTCNNRKKQIRAQSLKTTKGGCMHYSLSIAHTVCTCLKVLFVHPLDEGLLVVGQGRVGSPHPGSVRPARHGVEGELERLLDRHGRQVPVRLEEPRS